MKAVRENGADITKNFKIQEKVLDKLKNM